MRVFLIGCLCVISTVLMATAIDAYYDMASMYGGGAGLGSMGYPGAMGYGYGGGAIGGAGGGGGGMG